MTDSSSSTPRSEVSETDATAEIRQIYASLRHLTGVPVVALIFRHLATYEGLLPHIWSKLQPTFRSGVLQEGAAPIVEANIPSDLIPPISANVRRAIAFEGAVMSGTINAIDAYNRANATNFLIILGLLAPLDMRDDVVQPVAAREWMPPKPISGQISRMTAPLEMPHHIRRLINDLGFGDRTKLDVVVPSLFRHFSDAPGRLAILHVVLAQRFKDGSMAIAVSRLRAAMAAEAARLAPQIAPLPQLARTPDTSSVMRDFTVSWIPQMTVIGFALRQALSDI